MWKFQIHLRNADKNNTPAKSGKLKGARHRLVTAGGIDNCIGQLAIRKFGQCSYIGFIPPGLECMPAPASDSEQRRGVVR